MNRFIEENFDFLLLKYSSFYVVVLQMPCTFCADLGITNLVDSPTRGQSVLDLFVVNNEMTNHFSVTVGCPVSNSDHQTVVAIPLATMNQAGHMKKSFYCNMKFFLKTICVACFLKSESLIGMIFHCISRMSHLT